MDENLLWAVVTVLLLLFIIVIQMLDRGKLSFTAEEMHERLDILENSLTVVANVLQNLDQLVPSFHLPQQHPIQALLEFLKMSRGEEPTYEGDALRGPSGQFSDGDSSTEESSGPSEGVP